MSNLKNVTGFTLYPTDRMSLARLSDGDRGRLLLVLFDFFEGVDTSETLPPEAQMAFAFLSARLAEEARRQNHRREVNRSNAARRWSVREGGSAAAEEDG